MDKTFLPHIPALKQGSLCRKDSPLQTYRGRPDPILNPLASCQASGFYLSPMIEISWGYLQVSAVASREPVSGNVCGRSRWDMAGRPQSRSWFLIRVKGVRQCPGSLPELRNFICHILHCPDGPVFTGYATMSSSASKSDSKEFKVWQRVCSGVPGRHSRSTPPHVQSLEQRQSVCLYIPHSSALSC